MKSGASETRFTPRYCLKQKRWIFREEDETPQDFHLGRPVDNVDGSKQIPGVRKKRKEKKILKVETEKEAIDRIQSDLSENWFEWLEMVPASEALRQNFLNFVAANDWYFRREEGRETVETFLKRCDAAILEKQWSEMPNPNEPM